MVLKRGQGAIVKSGLEKKMGLTKLKDKRGFTLSEVLLAVSLLTVGILGITSLTTTTIKSNYLSRELTRATTLTEEKMEEIKRLATNEPVAGASTLGFSYLISSTGYLGTMYDNGTNGDAASGDGIYTDDDTSANITRRWTLEPYPSGGPAFDDPASVTGVTVTVISQYVDMNGSTHTVQLQSLINRRQFVQ